MNRLYMFVMAVSVMAVTCVAAPRMVKYTSTTDPVMAVVVDSVDYRSDLTRVYGKFVGRPHTSGTCGCRLSLVGQTFALGH